MRLSTFVAAGTLLVALGPTPARAQTDFVKETAMDLIQKVGVRANVGVRDPVDPDVSKGTTVGLSVGLAPGRTNGWKVPYGFTTFGENLLSPNGQQFATMSSIAVVAGIGYSHHFGRLSTGASLQTGYAFNKERIDGNMMSAFNAPDGTVGVEVGNALLLRPHVKAEYFITPKFTLRAAADYVMMRPDIAVTTPGGLIEDRWDASNAHASIGVSFYPFRK